MTNTFISVTAAEDIGGLMWADFELCFPIMDLYQNNITHCPTLSAGTYHLATPIEDVVYAKFCLHPLSKVVVSFKRK
jgi:hypothetical protein